MHGYYILYPCSGMTHSWNTAQKLEAAFDLNILISIVCLDIIDIYT